MPDQPLTPPPTWQEWKVQHGRWSWVLSPEWASEWIVYWSGSWDFVKVIELAGKLAVLFVAGSWFFEADEREKARRDAIKAKHYRAWELINSARGSTGDGGRRDALHDLNDDNVSLSGVSLANAYLLSVTLPGADLTRADLSRVTLSQADLSKADLSEANLTGAILRGVNLTRTFLFNANLTGAILTRANLTRARLSEANLTGAVLFNANLTGASLAKTNLTKANLTEANLTGADLDSAIFCGTTMPDGSLNNTGCSSDHLLSNRTPAPGEVTPNSTRE